MSKPVEQLSRFFKLASDGRWHRKNAGGAYVEIKGSEVLKRFQVARAKSIRRIE